MIDRERIQHGDHVVGAVPGFAGDPPVGGEQPDGQSGAIHGDADQMADRGVVAATRIVIREWRRPDSRGHAVRSEECMEMTVLPGHPILFRVGMIVVLRVRFTIIYISIRVMLPFVETALPAQ